MKHRAAIETVQLNIGYPEKPVLHDLNLYLEKQQLCCILGANGIGKSTLLKTLGGLLQCIGGTIRFEDQFSTGLSNLQRARHISLVLNNQAINPDLRIQELVSLGRSPHTSWSGWLMQKDHEIIDRAIRSCKLESLKDHKISNVSDGERQRAMVARCLAQDTNLILLDEPTAFLDYPNKILLTELLKTLINEQERTVVMSTHDWEMALDIADIIWVITENGTILQGPPKEVIEQEAFQNVFSSHQLSFDPGKKTFFYKDR